MRDILEIKDNFSLYKGIKSNLLWGNLNYPIIYFNAPITQK